MGGSSAPIRAGCGNNAPVVTRFRLGRSLSPRDGGGVEFGYDARGAGGGAEADAGGEAALAGKTNTHMPRLNDAQWAEVRALYESGEGTVRAIADRFGINDETILKKARTAAWLRRAGRVATKVGKKGPDAPVPPGHPTRAVRQALIRRLYKAIDMKLKHWEDRMTDGETLSAADSERMAKEVTTMISGFEKVAETEGAIEKRDAQTAAANSGNAKRGRGKRAGDGDSSGDTIGGDAERMRREIAVRLERLRAIGAGGRAA